MTLHIERISNEYIKYIDWFTNIKALEDEAGSIRRRLRNPDTINYCPTEELQWKIYYISDRIEKLMKE